MPYVVGDIASSLLSKAVIWCVNAANIADGKESHSQKCLLPLPFAQYWKSCGFGIEAKLNRATLLNKYYCLVIGLSLDSVIDRLKLEWQYSLTGIYIPSICPSLCYRWVTISSQTSFAPSLEFRLFHFL